MLQSILMKVLKKLRSTNNLGETKYIRSSPKIVTLLTNVTWYPGTSQFSHIVVDLETGGKR